MDALRLPPATPTSTRSPAASAAASRSAACCCAQPDLLLLDEPTNHLDAESVAWLERFLAEYQGTVVAVTHDRYFLDNVAGWILELDRGRGIPYEGNYSAWLEQKQKRLAQEEKQEGARSARSPRELEWVRMNPGRARPSPRRASPPTSGSSPRRRDVKLDDVEIHIPAGPRLGDLVIEAERLSKGFGDRLLFDDLAFSLPRGGIVGVIGPNGAGKTTLFRMITGAGERPTRGDAPPRRDRRARLRRPVARRARPREDRLAGDQRRRDTIELGEREINSRQYVALFNFRGADQQKPVGKLSGGERNRVHLAKLLRRGGNVLLLDEPTNDLDVDTLRALEEALLDFAGCAVVITHDRWFLDRVATHILAFEGDSQVVWFEGNFRPTRSTAGAPRRRGRSAAPDHLQAARAGLSVGGSV